MLLIIEGQISLFVLFCFVLFCFVLFCFVPFHSDSVAFRSVSLQSILKSKFRTRQAIGALQGSLSNPKANFFLLFGSSNFEISGFKEARLEKIMQSGVVSLKSTQIRILMCEKFQYRGSLSSLKYRFPNHTLYCITVQ